VPQRFLTQLCLTGDPIDAGRAREIGLVNDVADDLDGALDRLLKRLQSNSPTALRRGLYAMKAMRSMSFEEAIAFGEGQIGLLATTRDAREGIAAFKDKRKPQWTGK
jgi:enoyl-CoA hydratase/carnithine racemase